MPAPAVDPNKPAPSNPSPNPDPTPSPTDPPAAGGGGNGGGAPPAAASPWAGLSDAEKDRLLTVYHGAAQAGERRANELAGRIEALETKPAQPTPPDASQLNKGFYEKPYETVREIIREELKESVAPLQGFVRQFTANTEYGRLKTELRNDPRVDAVFKLGESYIDQLVSDATAKGTKLTRELVLGAAASVKGGIEMGMITAGPASVTPAPANPDPNRPDAIIPPHLRPSAPPAPSNQQPQRRRALDETEKRLARENGLTDDQYLDALEMDANAVVDPKNWTKRPS